MTTIDDKFYKLIEAKEELRAAQENKAKTEHDFVQACFNEGFHEVLQVNWSKARRYFGKEKF